MTIDGIAQDNQPLTPQDEEIARHLVGTKFHVTFRTWSSALRKKLGLSPINPRRSIADSIRRGFAVRQEQSPNFIPTSLLNPISIDQLFANVLQEYGDSQTQPQNQSNAIEPLWVKRR